MIGSLSMAWTARLHALAVRGMFAVMRPCVALILLMVAVRATVAQSASVGRLEGTIVDSVHAVPLAGVTVSATRLGDTETTLVVTADENGRFHFDSLAPGDYGVGFSSAFLDSLEFGGPASRVAVARGDAAR